MPNRIQVLTDQVASQIAAGEVIERPASVVKELVENSLDAGATWVKVEVQEGGKTLIRVMDNGSGMSRHDALLSLERHATSKISSAEDLNGIRSFGFRGEAVPSIASVSRFRLLTRESESAEGTEILIDGGKVKDVHEAGTAVGTTVEVRSLFGHVPARRKFLRTDQTEWAHIEQFLRWVAVARPGLHLEVFHNGTKVLNLPSDETLNQRLVALHGREWLKNTLSVEGRDAGYGLSGVVGKPGVVRADRQETLFFVNGRVVHNPTLQQGLIEGFGNSLMRGKYPPAVLFLECPPAEVDVNVHPAKREVRFREPLKVRRFIAAVIEDAIRTVHFSPVEVATSAPAPVAPPPRQAGLFTAVMPPSSITPKLPESEEKSPSAPSDIPQKHGLRLLGSLLDIYLIAENDSGLVLIDHRAAQERVFFEESLRRMKKEEMLSQALLLPVRVELQSMDRELIRRHLPLLNRAGIGVSEMGGNAFMIDALPPRIQTSDVEDFFRLLVADLLEELERGGRRKLLGDEEIATAVAREAVRLRGTLKTEEIERLLADLHSCDLPYTSPSGRPTMIVISRSELERKFGKVT